MSVLVRRRAPGNSGTSWAKKTRLTREKLASGLFDWQPNYNKIIVKTKIVKIGGF